MDKPVLEMKNVSVDYHMEEGTVHAVRGANYTLLENETLALVGESGCGKSQSSYAAIGLVQPPGVVSGEILFYPDAEGPPTNLVGFSRNSPEIRRIRGGKISMIFQEPMSSLSPVHRIGQQIDEVLRLHQDLSAATRVRRGVLAWTVRLLGLAIGAGAGFLVGWAGALVLHLAPLTGAFWFWGTQTWMWVFGVLGAAAMGILGWRAGWRVLPWAARLLGLAVGAAAGYAGGWAAAWVIWLVLNGLRGLLNLARRALHLLPWEGVSWFWARDTWMWICWVVGVAVLAILGWRAGWLLATRKDRAGRRRRAVELLSKVGIPDADRQYGRYSFEFSGGMRQRVMIAIALACNPRVLFADEPTTGLDVTIQAQILELIRSLQKQTRMSTVLITHDLAVVAERADRVAIMYLGRIVELADVYTLFASPRHPYTVALMRSVVGSPLTAAGRLATIRGTVPGPLEEVPGCPFHPRCDSFIPGVCDRIVPEFKPVDEKTQTACHLYNGRPRGA